MSEPDIRGLYVIFSKAIFVPEMFENLTVVSEPFLSAIKALHLATQDAQQSKSLHKLNALWDRPYFIPYIGQLEYDLKRNVTSRLLLRKNIWHDFDPNDEYCRFSYNSSLDSSYLDSGDFNKILHFPIYVNYKKKILLNPTLSHFHNKQIGQASAIQNITQNVKLYIHLYPTGIFYLHLAISFQSQNPIPFGDISQYIYALKTGKSHSASGLVHLNVNKVFSGTLTEFFQYIWQKMSDALFGQTQQAIISKTHDFVRIKPIEHINKKDFHDLEISKTRASRKTGDDQKQVPDNTWEPFKLALNTVYGTNLKVNPLWRTTELAKAEDWVNDQWSNIYEYVRRMIIEWRIDLDYFFSFNRLEELVEDYQQLGPLISQAQKELQEYSEQIISLKSLFLIIVKKFDRLEDLEAKSYEKTATLPHVHKTLKDYLLKFIRDEKDLNLSPEEIHGLMTKDTNYRSKQISSDSVKSV